MTKRQRKIVVRMKRARREGAQFLQRHKRAVASLRRLQRAYRKAA